MATTPNYHSTETVSVNDTVTGQLFKQQTYFWNLFGVKMVIHKNHPINNEYEELPKWWFIHGIQGYD